MHARITPHLMLCTATRIQTNSFAYTHKHTHSPHTHTHTPNAHAHIQTRHTHHTHRIHHCDDVDNGLDNTCEVIRQETVLFSTPETDYIIYD